MKRYVFTYLLWNVTLLENNSSPSIHDFCWVPVGCVLCRCDRVCWCYMGPLKVNCILISDITLQSLLKFYATGIFHAIYPPIFQLLPLCGPFWCSLVYQALKALGYLFASQRVMLRSSSATLFHLHQNYNGHCQLSEVYLIYKFWEMTVFTSSGDFLLDFDHCH